MTCFLLIVVKSVSDCLYACCFPGFRKYGKLSLLLNGGMHVRIFVFCIAVWWTLYSVNSLQPKHQQSTWLTLPVLAGFRTTRIFSVLIHAKVKSVTHIWPCCLPFFSICSNLGNFIYASCGSVCGSVSNSRVVIIEWVLCECFEYLFLVPYLHKLVNCTGFPWKMKGINWSTLPITMEVECGFSFLRCWTCLWIKLQACSK